MQVCLTPGRIMGCMSDGGCGSVGMASGEDDAALSQVSMTPVCDRESIGRRLGRGDGKLWGSSEARVTLSVHGWAKGHEREVVDVIKRELHSSNIMVHEIVSPADILLIFHDMRMGLHAEHLLGRIRHTAGEWERTSRRFCENQVAAGLLVSPVECVW